MTYRYQKFIASFDTLTSLVGFYCFAGLLPFFIHNRGIALVVLCTLIVLAAAAVALQLMVRFRDVQKDPSLPPQQLLQLLGRLGFVRFSFNIGSVLLIGGLHFAGWRFFHTVHPGIVLMSSILFLLLAAAELNCYVYRIRLKLRVKMNKAVTGMSLPDSSLFPQSALATAKN